MGANNMHPLSGGGGVQTEKILQWFEFDLSVEG